MKHTPFIFPNIQEKYLALKEDRMQKTESTGTACHSISKPHTLFSASSKYQKHLNVHLPWTFALSTKALTAIAGRKGLPLVFPVPHIFSRISSGALTDCQLKPLLHSQSLRLRLSLEWLLVYGVHWTKTSEKTETGTQ